MLIGHFTKGFLIRLGFLVASMWLLVNLMGREGLIATTILVGLLLVWQVYNLIGWLNKTNRELSRFITALKYQDFSQSFSTERLGSGFPELNQSFDDLITKFREGRTEQAEQIRYLKSIVDQAPVALLSLDDAGWVEPLNKTARRLLQLSGAVLLNNLDRLGHVFVRDIKQVKAGQRYLTRIVDDGNERQMILSASRLRSIKGDVTLFTLQDIQAELDATELSAWQDMVRTLTHEVTNSVTPISSLSETTRSLLESFAEGLPKQNKEDEQLKDIRKSIDTMARRSKGLLNFVQNYRRLAQMPPPNKRTFPVKELFESLHSVLKPLLEQTGVKFDISLQSQGLTASGDSTLLEQVLINLLKNAIEAVAGQKGGQVWLSARASHEGRLQMEVADNGPGIDPAYKEKIFQPFFTTKKEGSGVGLNIARQVVLAHGGIISAGEREEGGTVFRITI